MIGVENGVHLSAQELEKILHIKAMSHRAEGREIFCREPEQSHRRIQSPPIFRVRRPCVLLLQMHEPAGGLDQSLEKIRVVRFRSQPKMLEHVVRFIIALLIPALEEADITRM